MQTTPFGGVGIPRVVHLLFSNNLRRDRVADLGSVIDPTSLFGAARDIGELDGLNCGRVPGGEAVAHRTVLDRRVGEIQGFRLYRAIRVEGGAIVGEGALLLFRNQARAGERRVVRPAEVPRGHLLSPRAAAGVGDVA
jgi:hypothetical protein